ncbi:MAG: threonine ammonia-lyase [Solirubrobacterales bacterium]
MNLAAAGTAWTPRLEELDAIRLASAEQVKETPVFSFGELSRRCGGRVVVKAESLQRTGSFKLRGALAKLRTPEAEGCRGVVAASAGNHGQALAYAARAHGLRCTVFMPFGAAVSKLDAVEAFGGEVRQLGRSVDECIEAAQQLAEEEELLFVHPFNDLEIVKGQAGLGLELAEQVPGLAQVLVPVGGGGLLGGIAAALQTTKPQVRVVGIQAKGCAPFARSLHSGHAEVVESPSTIADGIAVKRPGELTLALAERWVDEIVVVDDDAIAEAMVLLAERAKLVVEGAGAVGVAALVTGAVAPAAEGSTAVVLSGGNVDAHVLASVINRHQTGVGRRTRFFTRISDRPGGLADLLAIVAGAGANVLDLVHVRDGVSLDVQETGLELVVETRNARHRAELVERIEAAGYEVHLLR